MSMIPVNPDGTVTLTPEGLAEYVRSQVAQVLAQQTMAAAGLSRRTPEELLAEADLPVTPEAAALLTHVPEERRNWLLRVVPVADAIRKGADRLTLAKLFDHYNGHATDPMSGQIGPAQASVTGAAA